MSAIKNPTFIATVLGVIFGATGLLEMMIESPVGEVYISLKDMLTACLSPLVLIVVGYNFHPERSLLAPCLKTILIRVILQAILAVTVISLLHAVTSSNKLWDIAVIIFMAAPTSFSTQTFVKNEEGGKYVATANSLYCIVTLIVYIILACFML